MTKNSEKNEPSNSTKPVLANRFFAYGGMKKSQRNTKIHISDDNGNVLCSVKSFWMQQYNELDSKGMMPEYSHINKNHSEQNTCKTCLKKFNEITGQNVC